MMSAIGLEQPDMQKYAYMALPYSCQYAAARCIQITSSRDYIIRYSLIDGSTASLFAALSFWGPAGTTRTDATRKWHANPHGRIVRKTTCVCAQNHASFTQSPHTAQHCTSLTIHPPTHPPTACCRLPLAAAAAATMPCQRRLGSPPHAPAFLFALAASAASASALRFASSSRLTNSGSVKRLNRI